MGLLEPAYPGWSGARHVPQLSPVGRHLAALCKGASFGATSDVMLCKAAHDFVRVRAKVHVLEPCTLIDCKWHLCLVPGCLVQNSADAVSSVLVFQVWWAISTEGRT